MSIFKTRVEGGRGGILAAHSIWIQIQMENPAYFESTAQIISFNWALSQTLTRLRICQNEFQFRDLKQVEELERDHH